MNIEQIIAENTASNVTLTNAINNLISAINNGATVSKNEATANTGKPESTGDVETGSAETGVELDKNGLPWDERIHASTKTKNADGSWKLLRNVDKKLVAKVEAELRAKMSSDDGEDTDADDEQTEVKSTKSKKAATPAEEDFDDDFGSEGEDDDELGDAPQFSLADVQKAVKAITKFATHAKRLQALLDKYGVESADDVEPADYAAFIEDANGHAAFLKLQAKAQEVANTSAGRDGVQKLIGKFKTAEGEKATKLSDIQAEHHAKFMTEAQKVIDAAESDE